MSSSMSLKMAATLALSIALASGGLAACGSDTSATTATEASEAVNSTDVVSAEAGAAARDRMAAAQPDSKLASGAAADSIAVDCGLDGEPYVPTAEELAANNGDTSAFAAAFDAAGIAYTTITDDFGFTYLEYDYDDAAARTAADAFWNERYPVEPPLQADLDQVRSDNDVIAAALDGAGIAYTRTTDVAGWDMIVWDYEDQAAQDAVNAAYAELYPPQPPSAEDLAYMAAENDKLAAAFDAAGVPYTMVSDEVGWSWIEWDFEDPAIVAAVDAVYNELYPVAPGFVDCPIED